mmetsp:Transcript_48404/g.113709  ORF Transcript_48404/g.113709 Transcript_48404/m.113709 type:complete len:163 (+) Transcript_48404:266-754(+)
MFASETSVAIPRGGELRLFPIDPIPFSVVIDDRVYTKDNVILQSVTFKTELRITDPYQFLRHFPSYFRAFSRRYDSSSEVQHYVDLLVETTGSAAVRSRTLSETMASVGEVIGEPVPVNQDIGLEVGPLALSELTLPPAIAKALAEQSEQTLTKAAGSREDY